MTQTSNSLLSKANNDGTLKFYKYQLPKMSMIAQNVTQTLNSLLSPTKSMVARATNGKQGQQ